MENVLLAAPEWMARVWWPFCRIMAALSAAPILGDGSVPVRVRAALSLLLAVVVLPAVAPVDIDPFSFRGVALVFEQILIGLLCGMSFHLVLAAFMVLGFLLASQMGFAMAVMNDPINGTTSDVISGLLSIFTILLFFTFDVHLVIVQIVYSSFDVWPIGRAADLLSLKAVVYQVGWVLSAALLLALPMVVAILIVQIGLGFLSRATPTINLFSLGFSVNVIFGLILAGYLVRAMPDHYVRITGHVLDMLEGFFGAARG